MGPRVQRPGVPVTGNLKAHPFVLGISPGTTVCKAAVHGVCGALSSSYVLTMNVLETIRSIGLSKLALGLVSVVSLTLLPSPSQTVLLRFASIYSTMSAFSRIMSLYILWQGDQFGELVVKSRNIAVPTKVLHG